jgi:hypothetical protein
MNRTVLPRWTLGFRLQTQRQGAVMRVQQERTKMGRISIKVRIKNLLEEGHVLNCDALVDTGSGHMVLPSV